MAKTGRPLSPHVQIYKFPPAAITSSEHLLLISLICFPSSYDIPVLP
jgi:hypothetical protein